MTEAATLERLKAARADRYRIEAGTASGRDVCTSLPFGR